MTNGDFIRSMSDGDIRENFQGYLCDFIKRRQPEWCENRPHCFHCVKDWLVQENTVMERDPNENG